MENEHNNTHKLGIYDQKWKKYIFVISLMIKNKKNKITNWTDAMINHFYELF